MRYIYWFLVTLLALVLVVFALSNRATATIAFWPWEGGVAAPLFEVALIPAGAGLLLGALLGGFGAVSARLSARAATRRAKAAELELAELRARPPSAAAPPAIPPPSQDIV